MIGEEKFNSIIQSKNVPETFCHINTVNTVQSLPQYVCTKIVSLNYLFQFLRYESQIFQFIVISQLTVNPTNY